MSPQKLVFLLAACGIGSPALAQRTTIAPLVPVVPAVVLPSQPDVNVVMKSPTQPAAPTADQPSRMVRPQPVFLINASIIVGNGLGQVNPQDIAYIMVYKGLEAPAKWRSLTTNGILAITLKPDVKALPKSQSLVEIGKSMKLRGPITYQLEGLPLEDLTLRVATADIARLDTQQTDAGTVVNIHLAVPPPVVHPPGTILIRGASGS
jgi:hypothetical protein